ncbi:surfeit locus protein 5 subunit 22 of mediator complex-domain-containing protein [Hyaloscypha sp. PMI_1271]|nr:surfeit locus protein 5 subunit 22 of mediator complex-domain-containing protein [Hyaloscypha sp. PMI_1271]
MTAQSDPLSDRAKAPSKEKNSFSYFEEPKAETIKDRQQRGVAALLTRFKYLVDLTATPAEDGATKEVAAANAFRMEVESSALVRAAEDLLQLTRELKEMWLFGPLRGIGEGEGEGKIDEDSKKVGEMVEALLRRNSGVSGP